MDVQPSLCGTWEETPKTGVSRDVAHIILWITDGN